MLFERQSLKIFATRRGDGRIDAKLAINENSEPVWSGKGYPDEEMLLLSMQKKLPGDHADDELKIIWI